MVRAIQHSSEGLIPAHAGKTGLRVSRGRWRRAHPRSRGENLPHAPSKVDADGSSPLTRGKRVPLAGEARHLGLIPAHAGKTGRGASASPPPRAHPRSRGENVQPLVDLPRDSGSSPLTRGKPEEGDGRAGADGLIPAHAGKTRSTPAPGTASWAHPRSRGENQNGDDTTPPRKGSSPLTRGKHQERGRLGDRLGLIPAHAGKTRARALSMPRPRAHPRSRGENRFRSSRAASP